MIAGPDGEPARVLPAAEGQPMLRAGLLAVSHNDGLLIEGGIRRRLLKSPALRPIYPVLPEMLALLDGNHDLESICVATGVDRSALEAVVVMLAGAEALEPDRSMPSSGVRMATHVMTFLSRMNHAASGYRSAHDLAVTLASSTVLIATPPDVGDALATDLAEIGVGSVIITDSPLNITDDDLYRASLCARAVVAVFDEKAEPTVRDGIAEVTARCRDYRLPVLRFACDTAVEVGPTFLAEGTACAGCFRRGRQAAPWIGSHAGAAADPARSADPFIMRGILAGTVTAELLAMLAGARKTRQLRMLVRIASPRYGAEGYDVLPEPDCATCGRSFSGTADARPVESYEWLESMAPGDESVRDVPMPADKSGGLAASLARIRNIATAPRFPLRPDAAAYPAGLREILQRATGWRSAEGASTPPVKDLPEPILIPDDLSAVEAYLVASGGLAGCAATIYRHEALSAELVAIRSDPIPLAAVLESTDLDSTAVEYVLVLVASVGQLRHRYGGTAIRMGFLAAGWAATDLAVAAAESGKQLMFASCWPAELADFLELDANQELIAAVAAVAPLELEV